MIVRPLKPLFFALHHDIPVGYRFRIVRGASYSVVGRLGVFVFPCLL